MNIENSTVLVTGANRGIGAEFVRQLKEQGAAKIYAGVRHPESFASIDSVEPIRLDVTNEEQVAAAAAHAPDVQIVINNAGIANGQPLIGGDLSLARSEFETNVFGLLLVSRAFAPVLATNGGGTILNLLSAVSWFSLPGLAAYSATKAAAWSLTDGLRLELAEQGTKVIGLHVGPVDTALGAVIPLDKIPPAVVVRAALEGIEAGVDEVLADEVATQIKAGLGLNPKERYEACWADGRRDRHDGHLTPSIVGYIL